MGRTEMGTASYVAASNENITAEFEFEKALLLLTMEFSRAREKHGFKRTPANPDMSDHERLPILGEEFGEVCRAMTYDEGSKQQLMDELIQTATMAVAWYVGLKTQK